MVILIASSWQEFLIRTILIMLLFFVAGILMGMGAAGYIKPKRCKCQQEEDRMQEIRTLQELWVYREQSAALWDEVDRILAEGREGR